MSRTAKVNQIVGPGVELQADICGSGVSNSELLNLVVRNCPEFEKRRGDSKVRKVSFDLEINIIVLVSD